MLDHPVQTNEQPLLSSVLPDGREVLFVVGSGTWRVSVGGEIIAEGSNEPTEIGRGVRAFTTAVHPKQNA